jgi:hypothetical protein
MLNWAIIVTSLFASVWTISFLLRVFGREPIEMRSHWGGLGGGTAGWRASPPLIALVGASVTWLMAGAFVLYGTGLERDKEREAQHRIDETQKAKLEDARTIRNQAHELAKLEAERSQGKQQPAAAPAAPAAKAAEKAKPALSAERAKPLLPAPPPGAP